MVSMKLRCFFYGEVRLREAGPQPLVGGAGRGLQRSLGEARRDAAHALAPLSGLDDHSGWCRHVGHVLVAGRDWHPRPSGQPQRRVALSTEARASRDSRVHVRVDAASQQRRQGHGVLPEPIVLTHDDPHHGDIHHDVCNEQSGASRVSLKRFFP